MSYNPYGPRDQKQKFKREPHHVGGRVCRWEGCGIRYFNKSVYCIAHRRNKPRVADKKYQSRPEIKEKKYAYWLDWVERNKIRRRQIALASYHRLKSKKKKPD